MKMKKILFFAALALCVTAAVAIPLSRKSMIPNLTLIPGNDYADEWKRVDKLLNDGMSKDARDLVREIEKKAFAEKNGPQQVRCALYLNMLDSQLEEHSLDTVMVRMKNRLAISQFPEKQIYHFLLGKFFSEYKASHYYELANRTAVSGNPSEDVATWDSPTLIRKSLEQLHLALEPAESLFAADLAYVDALLSKQEGSQIYRPTLFDLLGHQTLDILAGRGLDLPQPSYAFRLDDPVIFGQSANFVDWKPVTQDSSSTQLFSVQILQNLEKFHSNRGNGDALGDVQLRRMELGRSFGSLEGKDSLFLKGLVRLYGESKKFEISVRVAGKIAMYYLANVAQSVPNEPQKKDHYYKVLEWVKEGSSLFPKSKDVATLTYAESVALQKHLTFQAENVVYPNQSSYFRLEYRNLDAAWIRIAKTDYDTYDAILQNNWNDIPPKMAKLPKVGEDRKITLPNAGDHNPHAFMVDLPGLPLGTYAILLSSSPNFEDASEGYAYGMLSVSKLGFTVVGIYGGDKEIQVFDRETGKPQDGVKVELLNSEYDYKLRKYTSKVVSSYTTQNQGRAKVNEGKDRYQQLRIRLKQGNDQLESRDYSAFYTQGKPPRQVQTSFFLDRAIYRPGQTIFFKGLVMDIDGEKKTLKTGFRETVTFYDANYQEVSKQTFVTNEFGSYNGSFTAPLSGLTGQMHLSSGNGEVYFSVEEYKRPKFEVNFEETKGSFKLGQEVTVKGNAKAYAGSNIDGAKVTYRVVRQARFPWWCWWWYRPMPSSASQEIAHGELETDGEGKFEIKFQAIADPSISVKDKPEFSYTVYADVTDITGETRSSSTSVQVGVVALQVSLGIPSEWKQETGEVVKLSTMNLNGAKEVAKGEIKIYQLKMPDRVFRNQLFGPTDQKLMSDSEFQQKFPYDVLNRENERPKLPRGKEMTTLSFDTKNADSVIVKGMKGWPEGDYVAVLKTADAFGTPVELEQFFTLYTLNSSSYGGKEPLGAEAVKSLLEPGETAKVAVWSGDTQLEVRYDVELKGAVIQSGWVTLSGNKQFVEIPITENFRGNAFVHFTAFRRGRLLQQSVSLNVPWSNKDLKISFETFRDKLQPGANEEWRIKITGPNAEPVAAEMAAAMYDASLDAFVANFWDFWVWESRWMQFDREGYWVYGIESSREVQYFWNSRGSYFYQSYDQLNMFGWSGGYRNFSQQYMRGGVNRRNQESEEEFMEMDDNGNATVPVPTTLEVRDEKSADLQKEFAANQQTISTGSTRDSRTDGIKDKESGGLGDVKVRTNLNETAFFYPNLMTNEKGEIIVKFTVPEALTRWKIMTLAHTQDLKIGRMEKSLVTQKELMVMPNAPRFMREGDQISFSAKVTNLSDQNMNGQASLELFDALTMKPVNAAFGLGDGMLTFSADKGRSAPLTWKLKVPDGIQAVTYRVKAAAGNFTDGEESTLPVLTNRMLVTESMPLPVRGGQTKSFTFKTLAENKSTTLRHQRYTLEFTSSPIWYAVQALPYMMEYPYECTEQTWNRYYANSLATFIANSNPRFKQVFEAWKTQGPEALLSNLEKNQELKSLLLEETPWVMDAKDESERKKRLGLLFDLNKMAREQGQALKKLEKAQTPNGGFSWFPGMPDSPYITQYVLVGMAHLHKLGVINLETDKDLREMAQRAQAYTDERMREDYLRILKYPTPKEEYRPGVNVSLYLYGRTMMPKFSMTKAQQEAFDFFVKQSEKYVLQEGHYQKGLVALALFRLNPKNELPGKVLKSLRQTSIMNEEMGMYWKYDNGWFWYQAPIETHALLVEAFQEIENDVKSVDELRLWLLKQKQVQDWKTTKATAEACYALLIGGDDWLEEAQLPQITIGGKVLDIASREDVKVQAGTGYFKTAWTGPEINASMADVKVTNPNKGPAWGAVYWQYFEQLDKIQTAETPLKLKKDLFLQKNTDRGPELTAITPSTQLHPGDLVKVRIELRVDRDMEFVHMKDMRGSCFEPVNVLSRYKWQSGLGYYENTRDASTNFFFDWLPKGTWVFEYPLRVNFVGDFSNGITTIQSMYAPEFTSHSQGIRVKVGQ